MGICNPVQAEAEFYGKKLYLSYSAINLMLHSPRLYYDKYILGRREEITSAPLVEGKVIHCLLLDHGNFDKQFVVSPMELPTGNNKDVLDRVYRTAQVMEDTQGISLENLEGLILTDLRNINLHQSLKTDKQRLDKMLTEVNTGYYSYLLSRNGKTVIDQVTLNKCKEYETVIRDDREICKMLGYNIFESEQPEIINEKLFQIELDGYSFGLKGIPDSVVISKSNKTVNINDLKTTSKTIAEFEESIAYYRYDLQAAIQWELIASIYPEYWLEYQWNFTFIVIDKYKQLYPFKVSQHTMGKWQAGLKEVLKDAQYHYENKRWGLPRKYDQGEVLL